MLSALIVAVVFTLVSTACTATDDGWVADIQGVPAPERTLFRTLRGVVNRKRPHIYLLQDPRADAEGTFWLRHLGVSWTVVEDPWALFEGFREDVRGTIVPERAMRDSINVASTLAGLRRAVVAAPELAERLEADYGLPVLEDLRGGSPARCTPTPDSGTTYGLASRIGCSSESHRGGTAGGCAAVENESA